MLFAITSIVDFLSMAVSLWLALYLMTRSFSSRITLRGVGVLIALSAFFFGAYINLYDRITGIAATRTVFLTIALAVWNDLTYKLLPSWYQKTQRWRILLIYAFGFLNIILLLWTRIGSVEGQGDTLWVGRTTIQPVDILSLLFQLLTGASILYNFRVGAKATGGLQDRALLAASLLVTSAVVYGVLSLGLPLPMPSFIFDTLIFSGACLLGLSVARYQILIERRGTLQDFAIFTLAIFVLSDIYLFLAWQMGLSPIVMISITALIIVSHSAYSLLREFLNRSRSKEENLFHPHEANLRAGSEEIPTTSIINPDLQFIKIVEEGLRNLTDFINLGQSSLPERLGITGETHLEKGKAVQQRLMEAIEALRPGKDCPGEPIPREWHSYVVLHDAYWESTPNHDIMSKLYISEGTFHRTRRAAVRAVARALLEKQNVSRE